MIAASNLLEKLDSALLRPGRFDRQIFVSPPDVAGREAILKVHTRGKPLGVVDLELIARQTAGLTGADLANLCNEAAIFAAAQLPRPARPGAFRRRARARRRRHAVAPPLNEHERRVVAFHEAGHALCAELLPGVNRVHKISIVPRGRALGYTLNLPEEDRYLKTREELIDYMTVLLGGPRRRADRVRRGHHRRRRRPPPRRRDLALDDPRVRDGDVDHVAQGVRRGRRGVRPHASAARRRAAAPRPTRRCAPRSGSSPTTATSSTRWRAPCCATRCSSAGHRPHHGRRPALLPHAGPRAEGRRRDRTNV